MSFTTLFSVGSFAALAGPVQNDWLLHRYLDDQLSMVSSRALAEIKAYQEVFLIGTELTPVCICGVDLGFDVRAPGRFRVLIDTDVAYII